MKEKLIVASLLLFLSFFIHTKATLTNTSLSGVDKGDFACYEMYAVFTSSDPHAVIKVPEYEQNNTDRVRIDITAVSGTVIHQVYTIHFENESETFKLKIDLDPSNTSSQNLSDLGIPICPANLEVGNTLPTVELAVEETLIRIYPSGEREINHVSWNSTLDYGKCYFDKKTGMLVELNRTHSYANPITDEVVEKVDIVKMTNSSFWWISDSSLSSILDYIVMVIILGAFLYASLCHRHSVRCQKANNGEAEHAGNPTCYSFLL